MKFEVILQDDSMRLVTPTDTAWAWEALRTRGVVPADYDGYQFLYHPSHRRIWEEDYSDEESTNRWFNRCLSAVSRDNHLARIYNRIDDMVARGLITKKRILTTDSVESLISVRYYPLAVLATATRGITSKSEAFNLMSDAERAMTRLLVQDLSAAGEESYIGTAELNWSAPLGPFGIPHTVAITERTNYISNFVHPLLEHYLQTRIVKLPLLLAGNNRGGAVEDNHRNGMLSYFGLVDDSKSQVLRRQSNSRILKGVVGGEVGFEGSLIYYKYSDDHDGILIKR